MVLSMTENVFKVATAREFIEFIKNADDTLIEILVNNQEVQNAGIGVMSEIDCCDYLKAPYTAIKNAKGYDIEYNGLRYEVKGSTRDSVRSLKDKEFDFLFIKDWKGDKRHLIPYDTVYSTFPFKDTTSPYVNPKLGHGGISWNYSSKEGTKLKSRANLLEEHEV